MTAQHTHPHASVASSMSDAAHAWLDSLNSEQRSKATFHYMDGERIFWYYPPLNRHGLPLRDMDGNQRNLALSLLATGLTDETNRQANLIIEHEEVLGPLEAESGHVTWPRDPELYYWTVFGDPTGSDPWGWRAEGHHLSVHYSVWGDQILAVTPFFLGANPAEVRKGPKLGQRILGQREDLAIELMASLDAGQRGKAIIHDNAPWDILGYNSSKQAIHNDEGLAARDLNGTQKEMLMTLISEYIGGVPEPVAADRMARIRDTGWMTTDWYGPVRWTVAVTTTTASMVGSSSWNSTTSKTAPITFTRCGVMWKMTSPRMFCATIICFTTYSKRKTGVGTPAITPFPSP